MRPVSILLFVAVITSCQSEKSNYAFESEELLIIKLTDHVYQHISYLQTDDFGKVACNGIFVLNGTEVVVFDTPVGDLAPQELVDWVESQLNLEISTVVPTHFHGDCLSGIETFHKKGIKSVAHLRTINLAKKDSMPLPQYGFEKRLEIENDQSGKKILVEFFGEGHTMDNVIAYIPEEEVLFGGCLLKSNGAGKGFLGDANVEAWPQTVKKIKETYPNLKIVVPGHGKPGGIELLDYTIELFSK